MKNKLFEVFVCMLLIATVVPIVGAANWTQVQKLLASDGVGNDYFGHAVSISGNTALIGASWDTEEVGWWESCYGAVYVFTRTGANWTQQAKLTASDGAANNYFGDSVSLDGDTALIGAYKAEGNGGSSGAAYVFTRTGTTWTQQAKLTPSDNSADWFGCSVFLYGDTALIGASFDDENGDFSGSAYVFTRYGTTWTQQAKLLASDGKAGQDFGISVSLFENTALIGASGDSNKDNYGVGAAYVFTRSGTTWTQQQKLTPSDGAENDLFGSAVSLSGNTALIGTNTESAYVFTHTGTTWTQQAKLLVQKNTQGFDTSCISNFVCLSGDTALIGTGNESAYFFTRTGTTWTQQAKLFPSDGTDWDQFGCSVSFDGDTAFIGAYGDDGFPGSIGVYSNDDTGSAYVFTTSGGIGRPFADFTWTPSEPKPNQTITFDASASNAPQGSIILYEWDWNNDGIYEESHTTPIATHSWSQISSFGDTFTVTLRVTDNNNVNSTISTGVSISSNESLFVIPDTTPTKPKTPGFELVFVIGAIAISMLLLRKKRIV